MARRVVQGDNALVAQLPVLVKGSLWVSAIVTSLSHVSSPTSHRIGIAYIYALSEYHILFRLQEILSELH